MKQVFDEYAQRLREVVSDRDWDDVYKLARSIGLAWSNNQQIFLCGNGGSAANAVHLANDLLYGVSDGKGTGVRVEALPSNTAVLTCLANEISYEEIYSQQLRTKGNEGDVLIALSGSGNSPNIVRALEVAKELNMKTFAILGYAGGRCLELADVSIHFPIDDMQISEDLQLITGHMCMQWLRLLGVNHDYTD